MKRVGLIGEDPNDTASIKSLLKQKFHESVHFITLSKTLKGDQLASPKGKRVIFANYQIKKCSSAICIRDLDGFESQTDKVKKRLQWFSEIKKQISNSILLLNIWELEALIYADIETFNHLYQTQLNSKTNPASIQNPKENLKVATRHHTKQFHENDCPKIFEKLHIDVVIKNHKHFSNFIDDFERHLTPNKR